MKCGKRQVQLLPDYFAKLKTLTGQKAEDLNQDRLFMICLSIKIYFAALLSQQSCTYAVLEWQMDGLALVGLRPDTASVFDSPQSGF